MRVGLIINTHNEGKDVEWTIDSFREHISYDLLPIVVADGTTDGSCDNLGDDVLVLKTEVPIGCGKSKDMACDYASGEKLLEVFGDHKTDFTLHSDGHNRVLCPDNIDYMLDFGMEQQAVVTPAVGPLRCINRSKNDHCKKDHDKCHIECPDWEYSDKIPNNCYQGGELAVSGKGIDVDLTIDSPDEDITKTNAVNYSCFGYPTSLLDRFGGWHRFPGRWGMQECGFSLRCWYTDTPIYNFRDVVVLHRYRNWNGGKCVAPYSVEDWTKEANMRYMCRVCFDGDTWEGFWKEWFDLRQHNEQADRALINSDMEEQKEEFSELKRKNDQEFWDYVGEEDPLTYFVNEDAKRGIFLIGGGIGNVLMTIPAQKELYRRTGEPIDLADRGVHRRDVLEILDKQPWVNKIYMKDEEPDWKQYKQGGCGYDVDEWPFMLPKGMEARSPSKSWRTRHEVEIALATVGDENWPRFDRPDMRLAEIPVCTAYDLPPDYICIASGTAGQEFKRYPYWEQVSKTLHDYEVPLVFIGKEEDSKPWMDKYGINLCGKTSLVDIFGIIWTSRMVVCPDNGPSHIAACVDVPSFALYGPTEIRKNGPWTENTDFLKAELKCVPCFGRAHPWKCCDGDADLARKKAPLPCMKSIEPEYVASQILRKLGEAGWKGAPVKENIATRRQRVVNLEGSVNQCPLEMELMMKVLEGRKLHRILEIGVENGGWQYIMSGLCGPGAKIIGIDPEVKKAYPEVKKMMEREGKKVHLVEKKSQDALEDVKELLKGNKVDFLHIDGRHDKDFPQKDWEMYKDLVRPGGFIALHDINISSSCAGKTTVSSFYRNEIREKYRTIDICNPVGGLMGIGLVKVPRAGWKEQKDVFSFPAVHTKSSHIGEYPERTSANICAALTNYKRPKGAKQVVESLHGFGVEEVCVWNNDAVPIKEADCNISSPKNIGPRGKWLASLHTDKPWILVTDDDHILTREGFDRLCLSRELFPCFCGRIINPNSKDEQGRVKWKGCSVHKAHKRSSEGMYLDVGYPARGIIIPSDLYKRIPTHDAWAAQIGIYDGLEETVFVDDACFCAALYDMTKTRPFLVPSNKGEILYRDIEEEDSQYALRKQKGAREASTRLLNNLKNLLGDRWIWIKEENNGN